MELVRQKNVATIITFPIVDADGDPVTSAAGLDSEIDTWTDDVAPDGFTDCTNEATEIGTSGIYYLSLTQAECNVDYAYIRIQTSTSGAKTQHILIRFIVGDPLNIATTDDGGTINVTGGAIDTVTTVTTTTTNTDMVSEPPTAVAIADQFMETALSGHQTQGTAGAAITMTAYLGPRGPGIYIDDAAANTGTTLGDDGTLENPVSTIAAATTIASNLGIMRFYLINDTVITLAQTYEGYEFIGIGEIVANTINLGSQDVDNSYFENVLITGAQAGTNRFQAKGCALSTITGMEVTALGCLIAAGTLTLRNDCVFDSCWSAVAGAGTPILDINSVANVNLYFRHYSGGLQVNNAVATTTMSYESDGQLVIDATCTSLTVVVRGNCSITDNGTTTNLTQDGAVNLTNINTEVDTALTDYDPPTKAELDTVETNLTTEIDANETKIDTLTTTVGAAGAGLTNINLPNQTMDIVGNITGNLSGSVGSVTGNVGGNVTGSVGSVAAGGITAASIATDAVDADALAADAIAEINATVDIALSDIKLDHLVAVADADDPVDDSIVAKMAASDGDWSGFDKASDSLEALRDRGDAAWITGGGGSITDIVQVIPSVPTVIDLANTKTWRLALYLINSLDDLPTAVEITPGTIDIDRSADGGTTWANVVNGAACSELDGIIYYDEVFDTGTGYAEGDSIRVTFKNQKITVAANDYEISGATGMIFYSTVLQGFASLNDISVADILAGTVDVLDLQDTLKRILAWAAGEFTVNGNVVTYLEQDDATTEMVQTYTGLQRTVA